MSKELDSMLDQVAHQGHTVPKRRLTDEELEEMDVSDVYGEFVGKVNEYLPFKQEKAYLIKLVDTIIDWFGGLPDE